MGKKKLRNKEWEKIHQALIDDDLSIQDIANKYKVMRSTIYTKAWKEGWLVKGNKKRNFTSKIKKLFK